MYQMIVDYINSLNKKELENLYETYCDISFAFYIDSKIDKYEKAMNIVNLIDNTLREKGYWKK